MKIGLYVRGELMHHNTTLINDTQALSERVQFFFRDYSQDLFSQFLSFNEDDESLFIVLHPSETMVEFIWHPTHMICRAQTCSVGPGYHAYVVDLIIKLGKEIGITWTWPTPEEGNPYLKNRYFKPGDFGKLQEDMLHYLKHVCNQCIALGSGQNRINFPIVYPPLVDQFFAASQLQKWTKEWIYETASAEERKLEQAGSTFYIWWDKDATVNFYKRSGIAILNIDCYWRFPDDEREKRTFQLIDACFKKARQIDLSIDLPEEDWGTIRQYMSGNEVDIYDTEFGYRKGKMTFTLAFGWKINLPGYFYYTVNEKAEEIYFFDEFDIRTFSYFLTDEEKNNDAFLANYFGKEIKNGTEVITSENGIAGRAIINPHHFDDKEMWILKGVKVLEDQCLICGIGYPTEAEKEEAVKIWNSIGR